MEDFKRVGGRVGEQPGEPGLRWVALAAGRVDDERLFSLLAEALPPLVDGPEARAWIGGA